MNDFLFQLIVISSIFIIAILKLLFNKGMNILEEKEKLNNLIVIAKIAVLAVEQKWKSIPSDNKKAFAIDILRDLAIKFKIDVSDKQIDNLIEAMVYQLTNEDKINQHK